MPTYQYQCNACDAFFEVVQSFSDDALVTCTACDEPALRKVYGSVGVVFKGSGFYRTDSRSTASSSTPANSSTSSTPVTGTTPTTTSTSSSPAPSSPTNP